MAADLGVCVSVLNNRINSEKVARARTIGREVFLNKIRKEQYKAMERGSDRMLIWLGKNNLGQTDKMEASVTVEEKTADTLTWDDIETLLNSRKRTK